MEHSYSDDHIRIRFEQILSRDAIQVETLVLEEFFYQHPVSSFAPRIHKTMSRLIGKANADYVFRAQIQHDKDLERKMYSIYADKSNLSSSITFTDGPFPSSFYNHLHDHMRHIDGLSGFTDFDPDNETTHTQTGLNFFKSIMGRLSATHRIRFPVPEINN